MAQKLLDRFIFAFYCEDMGERMLFPPQMLRDHMKSRSTEPFYDSSGDEFWTFFRRLFRFMDAGGVFGSLQVPHINGGLFAEDPQIEALNLPNHVFAAAGQGANDASLESDQRTLLYLSGRYNFASRGDAKESITLYTLGRIFEQSITELEYRVGELEGRETIAKVSRRKRDGVYYTPEWVVNYLVEQTLDPWFTAAKAASGYPTGADATPDIAAVSAYIARLKAIRIINPACGSGAFLISAFRRLLQERLKAARELDSVSPGELRAALSETEIIADILASNIYGVDLNAAAVEIAKLALWLHTARAEAPLSMLDRKMRCGNSVVAHDFWNGRAEDAVLRERVNSFDWREAFPEIWPEGQRGGFDIVLGNPPYVKLQNMQQVYPDVVAYLQAQRGADTYLSARTGNFDLYLVFIEKGLRLLAPGGRMAYIAPNLWAVNKYGQGLRALMRQSRQLERWADFKSFQVFDEAITYTALQFFTREPQEALKIAIAPDGKAADIDWERGDLVTPYAALPEEREWLMATGPERALIERLARDCLRLGDARLTSAIFQGLITSTDEIYHLRRLGDGRYECKRRNQPPFEVRIEDAIMKPLVSGPEAKRYEEPDTDTYLLFPYERDARGVMALISAEQMKRQFPGAWAHLRSYEDELRKRESGSFNTDTWYQFGRPQNLDLQDRPKLVVAQTVPGMRVCADTEANKYLNNVRVNGIMPNGQIDQFYLLGALNGPVADFVFRRIGKPKDGGWFEANKQFIAPLPIPNASPEDRADIAARARRLQQLWTERRDLLRAAGERLSVLARAKHPLQWLWPDLKSQSALVEEAPAALRLRGERQDWAKARLAELEAQKCEALQAALDRGGRLEARFAGGELKMYAGGTVAIDRVYLQPQEGELAQAYWRWLLIAGPQDAARLAADLRRPPADTTAAATRQFIERVDALISDIAAIDAEERAMNERLYALYRLTPEERLLVEKDAGTARR